VFLLLFISSCKKEEDGNINYRQKMRDFVTRLSSYAKIQKTSFLIIPQNGQELITYNGESDGMLIWNYVHSIDATGREDLFFGYTGDDIETPADDQTHMLDLCSLCERLGIEVLTTDYCSTDSKIDSSCSWNHREGFISFSAPERNLNVIPTYPARPYNENSSSIESIHSAYNFLYLINSENFETKADFIKAVSASWYDVIIMDLFHSGEAYTTEEIGQLKNKPNGNQRLVVCYLSIGEAEDYRYYWQSDWNTSKPEWLEAENPDWKGNYTVQYWDTAWQQLIYGNADSYLDRIIHAGFDGAYLDLIDAFEYFESE